MTGIVTINQSSQDSFATAISYLMFGITAGLCLDLCAKWLLADYSLAQFVFLRSIFGFAVFISISRWYGGWSGLKTRRWKWHLVRTALAAVAMFGFFFGLSRMPLVNALTLAFTAPLVVTALSVPILGEHVGWRRWTAVIIGFAGVLIILRPGSGLLSSASLAVLAAAVAYAGLAITARKLAATETTLAMTVYVLLGPFLLSAFFVPGHYRPPTPSSWFFFLLAGVCSAAAWVGIVGGYRRASPAILAPFEYSALIGAAAAGYWIWGEVPDRSVIMGGLVIIGSGLFVVYREVGAVLSSRYLRAFTAATIVRRLRKKDK